MTTATQSTSLDPDSFVGRKQEQRRFEQLLTSDSQARVMMIEDGGGRGKSQLLRTMRLQCFEQNPPVPVGLVACNEIQPSSSYRLVRAMQKALREDFGLQFKRFRDAEAAWIDRRPSGASMITGTVDLDKQQGGHAVGAAVTFNGPVNVYGGQDPDTIDTLRDRAIEAFIDDLRDVCGDRAVVLILDAYEQSGNDLQQWVPQFLSNHVAGEKGVEKLRVVIAGQRVPHKELRLRLAKRYDDVVWHAESLSPLTAADVKLLLEQHGVTKFGKSDVDYLLHKINEERRPILDMVTGIKLFTKGAGG